MAHRVFIGWGMAVWLTAACTTEGLGGGGPGFSAPPAGEGDDGGVEPVDRDGGGAGSPLGSDAAPPMAAMDATVPADSASPEAGPVDPPPPEACVDNANLEAEVYRFGGYRPECIDTCADTYARCIAEFECSPNGGCLFTFTECTIACAV